MVAVAAPTHCESSSRSRVASATHALELSDDGGVVATPLNDKGNRFGQCGDGRAERRAEPTPRAVAGLRDVVAVAAGGEADAGHSLACLRDGSVCGLRRPRDGGRGDAAAGTWIFRGDASGAAAATTWRLRGDESRPRRGVPRGDSVETSRGAADPANWIF